MIIQKEIVKTIPREIFFVTGNIDLDAKYFIDKIEQGVLEETNENFKTNVNGQMTNYKYFLHDKNFHNIFFQLSSYIDENYKIKKYELNDAWGVKLGFGNYTQEHDHGGYNWSGAIYLNDHHQSLDFPEIKQSVYPEKGKFVIFPSFLKHSCKRNIENDKLKYGLSFNSCISS